MNLRTLISLTAVAACLLIGVPSSFAGQPTGPKIITFAAPGADATAGSFNGTWPHGINNLGVAAGAYYDVNGMSHGFLRSPDGKFTTFDVAGADDGTDAAAINDLGVITGSYYDADGGPHGYLRRPDGEVTTFDVPDDAGSGTYPKSLNLEGTVVGYYTNASGVIRGFVRHPNGAFTTFAGAGACNTDTSQGCYGSGATNINLFGTSAGGYNDVNFVHHGLVRSLQGKLTRFDVPGAGTDPYQGTGCPGCSQGLNLSGAIAGIYIDANYVFHGFLRSPEGQLTKFDVPGAGSDSYQGTGCFSDCPTSLNDWGAITGSYNDASFVQHGYLRSPAGKASTIDAPGSQATQPESLNDFGVVTGVYVDANSVLRGFLRIP
jgi:hypothetical protein